MSKEKHPNGCFLIPYCISITITIGYLLFELTKQTKTYEKDIITIKRDYTKLLEENKKLKYYLKN